MEADMSEEDTERVKGRVRVRRIRVFLGDRAP